jgi:site-specific recombinase XerD
MDKYLKQKGLMPSTRGVYRRVYENMDTSTPQSVVDWLKGEIAKRQPIGTLLPKRAMAKHVLLSVHGLEDEQADQMLPKLKGRAGKQRQGLTNDQYDEYTDACSQLRDPARTILKLLPLTGMRIAEICSLQSENLKQVGKRWVLQFRGKGDKERIVPLSLNAWRILKRYLITNGYMYEDGSGLMSGTIFETQLGTPVKPHYVRKYTRKIASERPILKGLSPHVLRHTFATRVNRSGVDLKTLQALLGHSQITTTSRYLHPTADDLMDAIDLFDKDDDDTTK